MNDKCAICGGNSGGYRYCASWDEWKETEDPKRSTSTERFTSRSPEGGPASARWWVARA